MLQVCNFSGEERYKFVKSLVLRYLDSVFGGQSGRNGRAKLQDCNVGA
jgi:hypothetical protein